MVSTYLHSEYSSNLSISLYITHSYIDYLRTKKNKSIDQSAIVPSLSPPPPSFAYLALSIFVIFFLLCSVSNRSSAVAHFRSSGYKYNHLSIVIPPSTVPSS